jgi:hypothetical protein
VPPVPDVGVDEVLDQVVPLPGEPPRRADDLVDVRVPDDVGHVVRQVAERVGVQVRVAGALGEQLAGELTGADVVQVVGPVPAVPRLVFLTCRLEGGPEVDAGGE